MPEFDQVDRRMMQPGGPRGVIMLPMPTSNSLPVAQYLRMSIVAAAVTARVNFLLRMTGQASANPASPDGTSRWD